MDYHKVHHMWQPLAAIAPIEDNNQEPKSFLRYSVSNVTSAMEVIPKMTSATSAGYYSDNEVLHGNFISEFPSSAVFNGTYGNMTFSINDTLNETFPRFNETLNFEHEEIWRLVTMIGTAIALGLLILATVIGESIYF